jgi:hypothetical protein
MNRTRIFLLSLLVIATVIYVAGCSDSDDPAATDSELYTREQVPDLNDELGGYNLADEAPGFGDEVLVAEFGDDEDFDDPMAAHPLVAERELDRERRPRPRIYLMVTWGNLHRDTTITHVTDWSGGLTVDPGVVLLERVIRFEPNDRILPRTEPGYLGWESRTMPGIDGVVLRIVPCAPPDTADADAEADSAETTITFATGPYTATFSLAELPGLDRIVTLDDGNAVSFNAVIVPPNACPQGFLRGVWRHHPERPGGEFFGKYADEMGFHRGFVKGHYGVNDEGRNVFFGKWISRSGRFEGILRGTYGNFDGDEIGWFAGHWMDRDRRIQGDIKGEYRRIDERPSGFFRGRWLRDCLPGLNTN